MLPFPDVDLAAAMTIFRILLCICWTAGIRVNAFGISTDDNLFPFANTTLSWTRDTNDPTGFWLNELQVTSAGNMKVLSMEVSDTSNSQGSLSFVFIRPGTYVIVATADAQNGSEIDFFTSPPVTVLAATTASSTGSSCANANVTANLSAIVTTTISATVTATMSAAATASRISDSVVIGATVGTVIPVVIICSLIAFSYRRKQAEPQDASVKEGVNTQKPLSVISSLPFRRQRPSNVVTPFVEPSSSTPTKKAPKGPSQHSLSVTERHPSPTMSTMASLPSAASKKHATSSGNISGALSPSTILDPDGTEGAGTDRTIHAPLPQRQRLLEEEAGRLRLQILGMVNQALSASTPESPQQGNNVRTENHTMAVEIERMRGQIEMLERQQDSDWARGLADEPPAYITSIGRQSHEYSAGNIP